MSRSSWLRCNDSDGASWASVMGPGIYLTPASADRTATLRMTLPPSAQSRTPNVHSLPDTSDALIQPSFPMPERALKSAAASHRTCPFGQPYDADAPQLRRCRTNLPGKIFDRLETRKVRP